MTPGVRYPLADGRSVVYFTAPLPHLRLFRKSTRVGSVWGSPALLHTWYVERAPVNRSPTKGKTHERQIAVIAVRLRDVVRRVCRLHLR